MTADERTRLRPSACLSRFNEPQETASAGRPMSTQAPSRPEPISESVATHGNCPLNQKASPVSPVQKIIDAHASALEKQRRNALTTLRACCGKNLSSSLDNSVGSPREKPA
jgi:hypothetical protein